MPALASIDGRTFDWIIGHDGRRIPPQRLWLSSRMDHAEWNVARYRVHQHADRRVTVEIVPRRPLDADFLARARAGYEELLGPGVDVDVVTVDRIDVAPGQRYRLFTSDASPPS
jgi:hypothetical protein